MTRLLLYTDEPILARGLETVISSEPALRLAGVCPSTADLPACLEQTRPELLLMDLTPELTFSTLVDVQRRHPAVKVILWVRTISTELAYQAIEHGIRGILKRTHAADTLVKCLQMVADGGLWFEETLKASFLSVKTISLTRRESQLVSLLSQGLKNKEIAAALFISEGTVKVYLSRLFHKLGVKDRFELALFGLRNMPTANGQMELPQPRPSLPQRKEAAQAQWLRSLVMERPQAKARGSGFDS